MRSIVFCTVVKHESGKEVDFLKLKYSQIQDPQLKQEILYGLTCGKDLTNLSRLFDKELELNKFASIRSILSASNDYKTVNLIVWNSIKRLWPQISKYFLFK